MTSPAKPAAAAAAQLSAGPPAAEAVKAASATVPPTTATTTAPCPLACQGPTDDINKIVNGQGEKPISQRAAELKANPQKQAMFWDASKGPRPKGSDQFGHMMQIEDQQGRLAKALQKYHENGCNTLPPATVKEASEWVMKDVFDML